MNNKNQSENVSKHRTESQCRNKNISKYENRPIRRFQKNKINIKFSKTLIQLMAATLCMCLTSSCLKIEKKDKNNTTNEVQQGFVDLHKTTQITYVASSEVTKYSAIINLNTQIDHSDVILEKQLKPDQESQNQHYVSQYSQNQQSDTEVIFHTQMYNRQQFMVDDLISDNLYKISFKLRNKKNEITATYDFILDPPKDLIIDSEYQIESDSRIEVARLLFKEEGVLRNGPYSLDIKAQKIIFEKGSKIESFDPLKTANYGEAGLHAGDVRIYTEEALGEVHFVSTGQNGGKGKMGWKMYRYQSASGGSRRGTFLEQEACNAGRGYDGGHGGRVSFYSDDATNLIIHKTSLASQGGGVGQVLDILVRRVPDISSLRPEQRDDCGAPSIAGKPGAKGQICLKTFEDQPAFCE